MIKKIIRKLRNPEELFLIPARFHIYDKVSDERYLKFLYRICMKKKLELENPQAFNEKLQWLKMYNRKPEYTMMVDKYAVREYIADKIGAEYLIPLLGVWDSADDIDFDKLPNQFVLKCNHNSGLGMCICKDKSKLNVDKVRKELRKGLKQDYYLTSREWPYKDVPRKIVAEKYMENKGESELKDYKFMCFNGRVEYSFVCSERHSGEGLKITFFDRDWNVMPFERHYPKSEKYIERPNNYDKMIELAEILSKDMPFVRIDFYEIDNRIYFGEITFFPGSGLEEFTPEEWDCKLGKMIDLDMLNG